VDNKDTSTAEVIATIEPNLLRLIVANYNYFRRSIMADVEENNEEGTPGYKVSAKIDMKTIQEMDQDDESLVKYKQTLLGKLDESVAPANDSRRVVILEMAVIFESRPDGDIVYKLDSDELLKEMRETPFILKEGCNYKIRVTFKVQHEIVSGLKYVNTVFRKGLRVAKEEEMLGSFGPQAKPHEVTFPRHGWEETPTGMISRGDYKATSKFIDDDKQCHLTYDYCFSIKKDWK